ncbi:motilin-like [Pseudoliparis swirei]|uniref:motilin-like n=1 Tax=Pseudoliparis swirei TaxID=2059687 RepID=UPI0024BE8294|nr:motilin-like [Pseudoliparis swirei]
MCRALGACLAVACTLLLLAELSEGHITFFSPKEMMLMKERKDMEPRSEDGQFEEVTGQQLPRLERGGNPDQTVEIAVRLSPKQLDHVTPVLEEILHEIEQELEKAK